jgi:hypothetical protein
MKPEIHGVMRKGKKLAEIAKPRQRMVEISEMTMSFMMFAPVWPMLAKIEPPAYAPKDFADAQRM